MNVPDYAGRLGPPGRGRKLIGPLRLSAVATVGIAVLGVVLPPRFATLAANSLVILLIGAPLARIAFFVVRWWRTGDRRYSVRAVGLLGVVALAVVVASL